MTPGHVRLVTLPASHAYVDAVVPDGVEHLDTRDATVGAWAPDPRWDPATWARLATDVDVVHVHFGFDDVRPDVLREWVDVTRAYRVRLVLTVHDLRNPHHRDSALLDEQLAVLVPAADVVFTLTAGAAAVVRERYGRDAVVVPHPAVFDGPAEDAPPRPGLVGVHLKSFRANVGDPVPGLVAVAEAVAAHGGARLRIDLHAEVADDPRTAAVRAALAGRPEVEIVVHDRFDDDGLRAYLTGLAVSVQLHRWGTHSGWVEAAHDVGTAVVSPDVGFLREQWPAVHEYRTDEVGGPDASSLRHAVTAALAAGSSAPADRMWREQQRKAVQAAHATAYRS